MPENVMLEPRLVLKEIRRGLLWNGIKVGDPSQQDPTQLNFQSIKGKGLGDLLPLKGNNTEKLHANRIQGGNRLHLKRAAEVGHKDVSIRWVTLALRL